MAISVIILEDNKNVALLLQESINATDDLVCHSVYHNAEEALTFVPQHSADIMIVDIGLPGLTGIDAISQLSEKCPDLQFCVFTVYEDDEKIFNALEAGAKGYILKNADKNKILDAIRELKNGGAPMSPYIARRVIEKLNGNSVEKESTLPISDRENQLLNLLSQGYTYKEIGEQIFISAGTVKQHLHRIYSKLHVSNKTQAINKFKGQ